MQITDSPGAVELEDSDRGYDIELKDVIFGYRQDQPILQVHRARLPHPICVYLPPQNLVETKGRENYMGHSKGNMGLVPADSTCMGGTDDDAWRSAWRSS